MCRRYLDGLVLLEDAEILAGLRFALERTKQALEPAGAAALAAVLLGRIPIRAGERVAVVASGGNVDVGRVGELLGRGGPDPRRAARVLSRTGAGSEAQLVEPVVVDPEVVGELVDHGDPDLVGELGGIRRSPPRAAAGRA